MDGISTTRAPSGASALRTPWYCERWSALRRLLVIGVAMAMALAPLLAGCKSGADKGGPSKAASPEQQKIGKELINQAKKGN